MKLRHYITRTSYGESRPAKDGSGSLGARIPVAIFLIEKVPSRNRKFCSDKRLGLGSFLIPAALLGADLFHVGQRRSDKRGREIRFSIEDTAVSKRAEAGNGLKRGWATKLPEFWVGQF